jgi:cytidylate kinase
LDGRDIGTVVCPQADVKLYVTAAPRERARRRWNEMQLKGQDADFNDILQDIQNRDARDMGRADSPLRPAENAHLLDTSQMDIETAFQLALDIIKQAKAG